MSPADFYEMEIGDFILKFKGFIDSVTDRKRALRRHAYLILSAWCEKLPSAYKIWPLEGDDELKVQISRHIDEVTRQTLEMHKVGGFEFIDGVNEKGQKVVIQKPVLN